MLRSVYQIIEVLSAVYHPFAKYVHTKHPCILQINMEVLGGGGTPNYVLAYRFDRKLHVLTHACTYTLV